jgi:hypothetical protein
MEDLSPMPQCAASCPAPRSVGNFHALLAIAIAGWMSVSAFAAGGPENALVVVNADSWASTHIANEYIAERNIPPTNVVYLRDLPDFERLDVEAFRTKILSPVLRTAEARGLATQIDCILYSADFPTAIDVSADMAGQEFPKVITQPASINGLTFLYQFVLAKSPKYLGMNANFYHRQVARVISAGPWSEEDQRLYKEALAALQAPGQETRPEPGREQPAPENAPPPEPAKDMDLRGARKALLTLKTRYPKDTELLYNLACVYARLNDGNAAIETLREAIEHGWWDMNHARQDPDLAGIRDRPDFAALSASARLAKFELIPTSGFRSTIGWLPTGQPVPPAQGIRYMLSTMLACTSGRGTSVREALDSLRRSVAADGSKPRGTIYFMENKDVRSTTRAWGFQRAAEKLREIGVAASVEEGVLPGNKPDVAGATIGSAGFDWKSSGSTILPGAICEHLTSLGGVMGETGGQTPLTEFIRNGAAGASGTVTEPFAVQAKFPTPFVHYHYAQGCTLAEAFYQSLAGPYQLLIVGDGLCAPWKRRLTVVADGLTAGAVLKGPLRISPTATSDDGITAASFELHLDGRRVAAGPAGKGLEFDTTKAPDGPHELAVVAIGADALATNASLRMPVVIRNGDSEFSVTAPSGGWTWDKPLEFTAEAPGAKSVLFFHNAREVARITGAAGSTQLDPRLLGQGRVRVQPVAVGEDGGEIWADPVVLHIGPPAALPAVASPSPASLANGFLVTPAGRRTAVVEKSTGNWLKQAGVANDDDFAVEGWFSVPEDDVYQFQIRGPAKMRLTVDGHLQEWPRGSEWWFVPVHLAKGQHRFRIQCKAEGAPKLEARFGGPGSRRIEGARFQHPAAE